MVVPQTIDFSLIQAAKEQVTFQQNINEVLSADYKSTKLPAIRTGNMSLLDLAFVATEEIKLLL